MNPLILRYLLNWRTWAILALLAVMATVAYKINQHGYNRGVTQANSVIEGLSKQINDSHELYVQSLQNSLRKQTEWQAMADQATQDANNAKAKLETIARDNQRLNDSLRTITSKANQRIILPDTTKADITEYTTALSDVFERCTSEYLKLAELAQSDAINAKQVIDSYPK
jgi:glutamate-1-semialdehyde aminotransferase